MFLSRNHTIERPHPIACQCADCVTKQNYDSLKRSRSGHREVKVTTERLPRAGQSGLHGAVEPRPHHDHVQAAPGDEETGAGREGVQSQYTFSINALTSCYSNTRVRPYRRCRKHRYVVFARWRQCAPTCNTWFLFFGPRESASPEKNIVSFFLFCVIQIHLLACLLTYLHKTARNRLIRFCTECTAV